MLVVNREMALMKRTIRFFIYLPPPPSPLPPPRGMSTYSSLSGDFLANENVRENIIIIIKKKKKKGEKEKKTLNIGAGKSR